MLTHVPNKICFFIGLKHVLFYLHLVINSDLRLITPILTTELSLGDNLITKLSRILVITKRLILLMAKIAVRLMTR